VFFQKIKSFLNEEISPFISILIAFALGIQGSITSFWGIIFVIFIFYFRVKGKPFFNIFPLISFTFGNFLFHVFTKSVFEISDLILLFLLIFFVILKNLKISKSQKKEEDIISSISFLDSLSLEENLKGFLENFCSFLRERFSLNAVAIYKFDNEERKFVLVSSSVSFSGGNYFKEEIDEKMFTFLNSGEDVYFFDISNKVNLYKSSPPFDFLFSVYIFFQEFRYVIYFDTTMEGTVKDIVKNKDKLRRILGHYLNLYKYAKNLKISNEEIEQIFKFQEKFRGIRSITEFVSDLSKDLKDILKTNKYLVYLDESRKFVPGISSKLFGSYKKWISNLSGYDSGVKYFEIKSREGNYVVNLRLVGGDGGERLDICLEVEGWGGERFFSYYEFIYILFEVMWQKIVLIDRFNRLSIIDPLTNVLNHRGIIEKISDYIRDDKIFSFVLLDIDYFKKINDENGHLIGDEVLRDLGKILKEYADEVGRWGGEEFALIFKDKSKIIELHKKIQKLKFSSKKLKITVSMGVSIYKIDAIEKEDLVDKADKALYFAKETGRNKVVFWNDIKREKM